MSDPQVLVVFVTGPDRESLAELGRTIVSDRLGACVNVLSDVRSIYRWEGKVEEAAEAMAIIKTTSARLAELESRVRSLHPYTEPEFLAFEAPAGSRTYLDWVAESVLPDDNRETDGESVP